MNNVAGISRRNLFKAAGVTAIAAAAAGTLTGCGKGYVNDAEDKNLTTQAPAGPSWLGSAPEIAESDITETIDTEVVVVGCRTGGLPAVISAAENGAKVLGIEQMSAIATPREDLGAINSRYQLAAFEEFPQFEIDKMEAMEDIVRYANGFVNYDLIKLWADESGAMIDWIADIVERNGEFKMWFEGSIGTENTGARDKAWATGHSPEKLTDDEAVTFGTCLRDYAIELGAEFRYDTMLVKCEQNSDGRVTGVICQDGNDLHYVRVNASKGVILATGGYVSNTEMVEARQAWNNRLKINVPVGGSCTGDGIKAAMWCGASIDPLGCAVTFNRACCKPDEVAGSDLKGKWFWFGEQPFLKVNLNGKRFCNEYYPTSEQRGLATVYRSRKTKFAVLDSNFPEYRQYTIPQHAGFTANEENIASLQESLDTAYAKFQGTYVEPEEKEGEQNQGPVTQVEYIADDTLEGLAAQLGLEGEAATNFVETINNYNAYCEAGADMEFGRDAKVLFPVKEPPFYACTFDPVLGETMVTCGGIITDGEQNALDENFEPIAGLYVSGNDCGRRFGYEYITPIPGCSLGMAITLGRECGKSVGKFLETA